MIGLPAKAGRPFNFDQLIPISIMSSKFLPTTRTLIRIALLSSPILALLKSAPMIYFADSIFGKVPSGEDGHFGLLTFMVIELAVVIFFQWCLNIYLMQLKRAEKPETLPAKWIPWNGMWRSYLISYGATLIIVTLLAWIQRGVWGNAVFSALPLFPVHLYLSSAADNTLLLLIFNLFRSLEKATKLQVDNAELQLRNMSVLQHQLQQQLQPHFLFNALYNLQLLIDDAPDQAKGYVSKLSRFLRASVDYGKLETVNTGKELAFFRDYMDLQAMRFGKAISYEAYLPGDLLQKAVFPVFSLQIQAENAIKHNAFATAKPLRVSIVAKDDQHLIFTNNKAKKFGPAAPSTGTGLNNLRKRFELQNLSTFSIRETETEFTVTLPLLSS